MRSIQRGPSQFLSACKVAVLVLSLLIMTISSSIARPGDGYGELIDTYCIERGRLRVPGHQSHCVMCHSPGTFDSLPEDRVEPNWTEFEQGKSTGNFDFFCPGGAATDKETPKTAPVIATSALNSARSVGSSPTTAGDISPMGRPPAGTPSTGNERKKIASGKVNQADVAVKLKEMHDALRITVPQDGAWRELADAVITAVVITQRSPTDTVAGRLRMRERILSERISALRGIGTALSRLESVLDRNQKAKLEDDLPAIIDQL